MKAPPTDWLAAFDTAAKSRTKTAAEVMKKASGTRDTTSEPSLPLKSYAGRYRDPWYGDVTIKEEGGNLVMRFVTHSPDLTGKELERTGNTDTFIAHWKNRAAWTPDSRVSILAEAGRFNRSNQDGRSVPANGFQFRFPPPGAEAGSHRRRGVRLTAAVYKRCNPNRSRLYWKRLKIDPHPMVRTSPPIGFSQITPGSPSSCRVSPGNANTIRTGNAARLPFSGHDNDALSIHQSRRDLTIAPWPE